MKIRSFFPSPRRLDRSIVPCLVRAEDPSRALRDVVLHGPLEVQAAGAAAVVDVQDHRGVRGEALERVLHRHLSIER